MIIRINENPNLRVLALSSLLFQVLYLEEWRHNKTRSCALTTSKTCRVRSLIDHIANAYINHIVNQTSSLNNDIVNPIALTTLFTAPGIPAPATCCPPHSTVSNEVIAIPSYSVWHKYSELNCQDTYLTKLCMSLIHKETQSKNIIDRLKSINFTHPSCEIRITTRHKGLKSNMISKINLMI